MGGKLSVSLPNLNKGEMVQKITDGWNHCSAKVKDGAREEVNDGANVKGHRLQRCLKNLGNVMIYGMKSEKQKIPCYLEEGILVEVIQDGGLSFRAANVLQYLPSRKRAVVQFNVGVGNQPEIIVVECEAIRPLPDYEETQFSFADAKTHIVNVYVDNLWRVGVIVTPPATPEEDKYRVLIFRAEDEDYSITASAAQLRKHKESKGITLPKLQEHSFGLVGVAGLRAEIARVLWVDRVEVKFLELTNSRNEPIKQIIRREEWYTSIWSYRWDKLVWTPFFKSVRTRRRTPEGTVLDDYESYLPAYISIGLLQIMIPFLLAAASTTAWPAKQLPILYILGGLSVFFGTMVVTRMLHGRITVSRELPK